MFAVWYKELLSLRNLRRAIVAGSFLERSYWSGLSEFKGLFSGWCSGFRRKCFFNKSLIHRCLGKRMCQLFLLPLYRRHVVFHRSCHLIADLVILTQALSSYCSLVILLQTLSSYRTPCHLIVDLVILTHLVIFSQTLSSYHSLCHLITVLVIIIITGIVILSASS